MRMAKEMDMGAVHKHTTHMQDSTKGDSSK